MYVYKFNNWAFKIDHVLNLYFCANNQEEIVVIFKNTCKKYEDISLKPVTILKKVVFQQYCA